MIHPKSSPKILVIGLDGVPFEYLDPLLEQGLLPNIATLIDRGFRSPLRSVYPPMTPVAWPSFATGKNPGKHGVFGWWELKSVHSVPTLLPVSGRSVKGPTIWDILSRHRETVGLVNVPLTYPAREVNGFLIAGLDNPFEDPESSADISYPPGLLAELAAQGINYKVLDLIDSDIPPDSTALEASLQRWDKIERERTKAAQLLIDRFAPTFMMIVYHMADYFMHRVRRDSPFVRRSLETLDSCIGLLLDRCEDDTCVMVISDHGSIELKKYIYLQNWLVGQELLKFKDTVSSDNLELIVKAHIKARFPELSLPVIRSMATHLVSIWNGLPTELQQELTREIKVNVPACCMSDQNIDWSATRVFTISSYGEIYINLRGRQPRGIVEPGTEYDELVAFLIKELSELQDPETGTTVLSRVVQKESCYFGEYLDSAPDILCFVRDPQYYFMRYNYYMRPATTLRLLQNKSDILIEPVTAMDDYIGDHTFYGIFVAAGGGVKAKGKSSPCQILDLAPTILSMFGVPVPKNMDGQVLSDHFALPSGFPIYTAAEIEDGSASPQTLTKDDLELVRKKLRSLGYNV
jgi:predicted AlkP superfamily phosphohydrolase/phosphomutase